MQTGEKIKRIRQYRGLTQKELAVAIGLKETAANRITQYEIGYRVPKKDTLDKMATALNCNPMALYDVSGQTAEEILQILFWLEESAGSVNLFQMDHYHVGGTKGKRTKKAAILSEVLPEDDIVRYHDSDRWSAHPPVGLWFDHGVLNSFLKEWMKRKEELRDGVISREEYFEWKITWPYIGENVEND